MSDSDAPPANPCPNCRQPMRAEDLERNNLGTVRVQLCFACAGIWFDHLASVELAPAAIMALFKEIQSHRDEARQPLAGRPNGDGRFTPFFQFLREKQFVRSLTDAPADEAAAIAVRVGRDAICYSPADRRGHSRNRDGGGPRRHGDPRNRAAAGALKKVVGAGLRPAGLISG